jgi:uncharacterized membrane protein
MRKQAISVLLVALVGFVGCNKSEPGGGTPKGDSFTVSGPATSTTIKQGETRTEKLTLSRGKDFKEDVSLSAGELPKGFKVEFAPTKVMASDKPESEMKVTVDKDAPLGDSTITVTAKPAKGNATTLVVKIKVEKGAE